MVILKNIGHEYRLFDPGGGHGNPLQNSCRNNPMGRRAWQSSVHGLQRVDITEVTEHAKIIEMLV